MTTEATWEQKFEAMQGLGDASLKMRAPGKWYVHQPGVEVKATGRFGKDVTGEQNDGADPQTAVNGRWKLLTSADVEYKRGRLLRRVRWNGFMWADLVTDDAESAPATT